MNDLPVGRSVDETLRLVQAFQYTDQHGEVCPAGWKPGSDTVSSSLLVIYITKGSTRIIAVHTVRHLSKKYQTQVNLFLINV